MRTSPGWKPQRCRFCDQVAAAPYLRRSEVVRKQKRERARLLTWPRVWQAGFVRSGPADRSRRAHLRSTRGSPVAPMWDPYTRLLSWLTLGPRLPRSELGELEECK